MQGEHSQKRNAGVVTSLGLFLLALLPRAIGLGTFATADEAKWVYRSAQFLGALLRGDLAGTVVNLTPALRSQNATVSWMNFSLILSRTTYSSKVIVNDLPVNSTVPFSGRLFNITGGSVSFGPPEGELIFAHDSARNIITAVAPALPDMCLPRSTVCKLTSNFVNRTNCSLH